MNINYNINVIPKKYIHNTAMCWMIFLFFFLKYLTRKRIVMFMNINMKFKVDAVFSLFIFYSGWLFIFFLWNKTYAALNIGLRLSDFDFLVSLVYPVITYVAIRWMVPLLPITVFLSKKKNMFSCCYQVSSSVTKFFMHKNIMYYYFYYFISEYMKRIKVFYNADWL